MYARHGAWHAAWRMHAAHGIAIEGMRVMRTNVRCVNLARALTHEILFKKQVFLVKI